jgi:hypothetical protein
MKMTSSMLAQRSVKHSGWTSRTLSAGYSRTNRITPRRPSADRPFADAFDGSRVEAWTLVRV